MNPTIEMMEDRLRQAVLSGDVTELEDLLGDDVVFIDPTGRRIGKEEDLEVYRRNLVSVDLMEVIERRIRVMGDIAVTHTLLAIAGHALGTAFDGMYHYTRVWKLESGRWQVIAAHATAVQR
jgi:ketosteroid isomerase-like protein